MRGSPRNYLKDESKIQIGFRSSNENAGAAGHFSLLLDGIADRRKYEY
jgi:hypothetical protein